MKRGLAAVTALVLGLVWARAAFVQNAPNDQPELPFSAARQAGNTLYLSGQIARTPDGELKNASITEETHQVMKNLGAALREHGYTFDDVVKATVYLESMADYAEMNAAYASYFDGAYPARECTGGHELAFGCSMEISMIAYKDDD